MKARQNSIDPDELQLMDECNRVWVQSWNKAMAHINVMKVEAISIEQRRKKLCQKTQIQ